MKDIKFIRGDTYLFKFQRKNLEGKPIIEKAQKMWFTVKKNYKKQDKMIQKTLADGNIIFDAESFYHIRIDHEDTTNLKYGKYVYDIQVENDGIVSTVALGKFEITNEVTFEGGNS